MYYCYVKDGEYIIGIASSSLPFAEMVSEAEANNVKNLFLAKPADPSDNWQYKLRADNLEWELVELPPVPEEPITEDEALVRYSNEITGSNDAMLTDAAETLIKMLKEGN